MTNPPLDPLQPILHEHFVAERSLTESFLRRLESMVRGLTADSETALAEPAEGWGGFADLLFETIAALEDHASEEERFMKLLDFGGQWPLQYERHIEDHASLAETMCAVVEAYGTEETLLCARRLHELLIRWKDDHIENHDKPLLNWIALDT